MNKSQERLAEAFRELAVALNNDRLTPVRMLEVGQQLEREAAAKNREGFILGMLAQGVCEDAVGRTLERAGVDLS